MKAALVLALSLLLLLPVQRWLDAQPSSLAVLESAAPYPQTGAVLRWLSCGFHAVLADVYWLRTIQYFGGQLASATTITPARFAALPTWLDAVTELDPQHVPAYRFGAAHLPYIAPTQAIAFIERGIRDNPHEWRLYLDLGYAHWRARRFAAARAAYERGSQVAGAPAWLLTLAATMAARGGERSTAREIFTRLAETSSDQLTREVSLARLAALRALDEVDALNAQLAQVQTAQGRCPLAQVLAAHPRDAADYAYAADEAACRLALAPASPLARWLSDEP